MEAGARPPDPATRACLPSGKTPKQFAPELAKAFFPAFNQAPPQFIGQLHLPPEAGACPAQVDMDGIQGPFTVAEFVAAIDQTKLRTSPGPDGITYEVLKNADGPALQRILDSLNAIWASEELPASWKHAEVVPIPKPGKPVDRMSNLRPIALTCTICKLLGRMFAARLSW